MSRRFLPGDFVFWTRKNRDNTVPVKFKAEVLRYTDQLVTVKLEIGPNSYIIKHVEEQALHKIPAFSHSQNRMV